MDGCARQPPRTAAKSGAAGRGGLARARKRPRRLPLLQKMPRSVSCPRRTAIPAIAVWPRTGPCQASGVGSGQIRHGRHAPSRGPQPYHTFKTAHERRFRQSQNYQRAAGPHKMMQCRCASFCRSAHWARVHAISAELPCVNAKESLWTGIVANAADGHNGAYIASIPRQFPSLTMRIKQS